MVSEFLSTFLSTIGGTAVALLVLGFLFRAWISARLTEGIKAEYGELLELLKSRLANTSKIQEKRVAALDALHSILVDLIPIRQHEDEDWDAVMQTLGLDMDKHQEALRKFDREFGSFLPQVVRNKFSEACGAVGEANLPTQMRSSEDLEGDLVWKGVHAKTMFAALEAAKSLLEQDIYSRTKELN